jgi:glycosyltransferase involved in cell wall biosynthesis
MIGLADAHLILFLTQGASLRDWARRGLLAREARLYQRLRPFVKRLSWVTYGGLADLEHQADLPDIELLVNRWRLPIPVYIQQLPWLHREAFQSAHLLKAEQTGAGEAALRVSQYFGTRLIARSGFSLALFAGYAPHEYAEKGASILALERRLFAHATQIVVTTEEMRQTALATHALPPDKVRIIPNYVDTDLFQPSPTPKEDSPPRLVFIGRLVEQKNILNLVEAIAGLPHLQLDIVGDGELRQAIEKRLQENGLTHIRLIGNLPHPELPRFLHGATLYVQPSRYEGHPKTIFEAMACGLPVVVGDSPGIRQFIDHGHTGWLCGLEADAIRSAVQTVLAPVSYTHLRAHET